MGNGKPLFNSIRDKINLFILGVIMGLFLGSVGGVVGKALRIT